MGTFTYDTSTDIGKVRLYLRDHNRDRHAYTDEELQVFIDAAGDWQSAVGDAARNLLMEAARFARIFTDQEGNVVDETAGAQYLESLIDRFGGGATVLRKAVITRMGRHPHTPRNVE